nr:hypothetical protein [Proteiniphilum sp. UBA1028]
MKKIQNFMFGQLLVGTKKLFQYEKMNVIGQLVLIHSVGQLFTGLSLYKGQNNFFPSFGLTGACADIVVSFCQDPGNTQIGIIQIVDAKSCHIARQFIVSRNSLHYHPIEQPLLWWGKNLIPVV